MVSEVRVVAGQAEHGVDAVGVGADDVALHGQAVTVSCNHLEEGIEPHLFDDDARGQAGHSHHGRLVVGDVDRIHTTPEQFGLFP